eukprot:TRINITY_DN12958_c0_g1_i1.p1 TRINITY_DN12958_c0_g1~~TRINITY_DN12958_c0_g1_i1.p1  ORF type:complete len:299 (+),score=68.81 TRINITY_DN12958_c0_g1_i1:171-1067(+)
MRLRDARAMEEVIRDYSVIKTLHRGAFAQVQLVQDQSKNLFALKIASKSDENFKATHYVNEIEAGKRLHHDGICKLADQWEDEANVYLLMQFIKGTDLITIMERRRFQPLGEGIAKSILHQIIRAVDHCHMKNVAHRDLKLDNIMLEESTGQIKLIDFGLCKTSDLRNCREDVGSVEYISPEILKSQNYDACKSDVWSLGIILYGLLFGQFPFSSRSLLAYQKGECQLILRFPAPAVSSGSLKKSRGVSEEAQDLITKMLKLDPKKRPSMYKISKHPWFRCQSYSEYRDQLRELAISS